jgi:F-type H+-transporting ATPase subunit a
MSGIDHTIGLTKAVNKYIGPVAKDVLSRLNLIAEEGHASFPQLSVKTADGIQIIIPDHTVQAWAILVVMGVFAWWYGRRLKVVPRGFQHILEIFSEVLHGFLVDIIGPKGPKYFPLIATLALFIFISNIAGLVPGLMSPTNNLNTTVACALIVFFYYHFQGIKEQGLIHYAKHFAGPVWWLAPIMVPIELIGHLARPLSLSIRLFGNIMGEDIVIIILFILAPQFVPIPMMLMAIFTSLLQAFIFIMLSMMYIAGAVAAEEH